MMKRYKRIVIALLACLCLFGIIVYGILFYPQQSMPIGEPIPVTTIEPEKYHNDCLHPCIRYREETDKYHMAQSPYYAWNSKVENPMFYTSDTYQEWDSCILISDTPERGFNSDPNICLCPNGDICYLWRECFTPLCDSLGCYEATVGGLIKEGRLLQKEIFCVNSIYHEDTEQAPVMIERDGIRYIYATWYQYEPERKNRGIAIWRENDNANRGGHMCKFQFVDTIPFNSTCTVDRIQNIPLFGYRFYIPKPLYHDLWHFDLFAYDNKLYMVSVAEKGDNIMLSVADDWNHFKTFRKPLVNNHYTENYCGYRQYFYKPTAYVQNDTLHLFYTANAKDNSNRNQLYHTSTPINDIIK